MSYMGLGLHSIVHVLLKVLTSLHTDAAGRWRILGYFICSHNCK